MNLPNYSVAKTLVLDLETKDPQIEKLGPGWATGNGHVVGYGIGVLGEPKTTRYIAVRHEGYKNDMEPEAAVRLFNSLKDITKIYFNGPYDMGWQMREGIDVLSAKSYCAMQGAALIDERRQSYSLENVGLWLVGRGKVKTNISGSDIYMTSPEVIRPYGIGDVNLTGDVWLKELEKMRADDLMRVLELEAELLPMIVQMRWNGIAIDEEQLEITKAQFQTRAEEIVSGIRKQYGVAIDLWNARSIASLCEKEHIEYPRTKGTSRTPDGQPSFTKLWLEAHPHPAMQAIARGRKFDKAAGTFLEGLQRYCINGKVHAEIHSMKSDDGGTVTGRWSISNPGLHQMPARDPEISKPIRGLFIPHNKKKKIGSLDYSQQEPRLMIHYAALLKLQGAEAAVKQFTTNPRTDYHQWSAETFGAPRKVAKIINLGLAYGMGINKLSFSLGCSYQEAKDKLDDYFRGMPWMRELQRVCSNKAADRGYIKTILGRRCRYDRWEPVNHTESVIPSGREEALKEWPNTPLRRSFTYRAMNGLIQGSAADQTKAAMRDLYYNYDVVPLLQMHDELLVEVTGIQEARKHAKVMEDAIPLAVPAVVDVAVGKNWGECSE